MLSGRIRPGPPRAHCVDRGQSRHAKGRGTPCLKRIGRSSDGEWPATGGGWEAGWWRRPEAAPGSLGQCLIDRWSGVASVAVATV
ncbi:hypothetical protein FMEAI12_2980007 [Parafrankia sp. Ea1.12]|nr:hypothetical protein FMEAI12_2980007 [Parafrankia sp. Ea1.12]